MKRIILVGGAPRSGTTALHGLLCTASNVNNFCEEPSYLGFMLRGWTRGAGRWKAHTFDFNDTFDDFKNRQRRYITAELEHIWSHLGKPDVLALKDPTISAELPMICELLPNVVAALSIRNPYAVVRSRQEVFELQNKRKFSGADAMIVADEFAKCYEAQRPDALITRYEDFPDISAVSDPLRIKVRPDMLWNPKGPTVSKDSPWFSPKYKKSLDTSNRLSELAPEFKEIVNRRCGDLMSRFGYED